MTATACVPAADGPPAQDHDVAGRVHGLWDGADGVVLRLHADGVDVLRTASATGINGNQNDNSAIDAGAAYVFQRTGQTWAQQAYLKASNTLAGADFGFSISLSDETLAVGADRESGGAIQSGAAYVFVRSGTQWTQQAYLKASNVDVGDDFGSSIAISGDQLVVGALNEDSIATGINGDQSDNSAVLAGAAYLFARSGGVWTQQAYIKPSNTHVAFVDRLGDRPPVNGRFGAAVAVSGTTLVVSAANEFSGSAGFNGNQADQSKRRAGAIYIFQE
jgi:hypothetical protein